MDPGQCPTAMRGLDAGGMTRSEICSHRGCSGEGSVQGEALPYRVRSAPISFAVNLVLLYRYSGVGIREAHRCGRFCVLRKIRLAPFGTQLPTFVIVFTPSVLIIIICSYV